MSGFLRSMVRLPRRIRSVVVRLISLPLETTHLVSPSWLQIILHSLRVLIGSMARGCSSRSKSRTPLRSFERLARGGLSMAYSLRDEPWGQRRFALCTIHQARGSMSSSRSSQRLDSGTSISVEEQAARVNRERRPLSAFALSRRGAIVIEIRRASPSDHTALSADSTERHPRAGGGCDVDLASRAVGEWSRGRSCRARDTASRSMGRCSRRSDRMGRGGPGPSGGALCRTSLRRPGVGSRLLLRAEAAIRDGGHATARLESSPNAATFYLHRGYLPSEARTADGALPRSKRLSRHEPIPPPQPAGSAGG